MGKVTPSRWSRFRAAATRTGPSRLISTAVSSGESKLTVAAEWMTVGTGRQQLLPGCVETEAVRRRRRRPAPAPVGRPRRRSWAPSSRRSRSKQLFFSTSRRTRSAAPRRPGRTSRATSLSGIVRKMRSTRAVPRKPVAPVMAMRRPRRASRSISACEKASYTREKAPADAVMFVGPVISVPCQPAPSVASFSFAKPVFSRALACLSTIW